MTMKNVQCFRCKNQTGFSKNGIICKAYPNGVPDKIVNNEFDHTKAFKGDHGIRFEKKGTK